jgi:putative ABC transport system permease protein
MHSFYQDVRYAVRMLLTNPAFTAIAMTTLALGIGANTAIFTVLNAVLLRPLPYSDSAQIVRLYETFLPKGWGNLSVPNLKDWNEQNQVFEGIAAYSTGSRTLQQGTNPERINAIAANANLFSVLRTNAMLGRTFAPDEDQPGKPPVVVLSEALWRTRFKADPDIVGRTIQLDSVPHTVIGVMPKSFYFPPRSSQPSTVWVPLQYTPDSLNARGNHMLFAVARMRPGVTVQQAQAQMNNVSQNLSKYPENNGRGAWVVPLHEDVAAGVRPTLIALSAAVALVLLIACANVANLLLARAIVRRKEISIRMALGASPGRLIRQVLTECVIMAVMAGLLGAVIATWGVDLLVTLAARQLPRSATIGYDSAVFLYLLGISVLTGLIFGVFPAIQAVYNNVQDGLRDASTRTGSSLTHSKLRSGLVVSEVALATVLLIAAGLLIKTFFTLQNVAPGVQTQNVLTFRISIPQNKYPIESVATGFQEPLLQRLRALPGVTSVGLISHLPLESWGTNGGFGIEGRAPTGPADAPFAEFRMASTQYFKSVGVPVLRGRDFTDADNASGPPVVIINKTLADTYFKGEDPIGKRLILDSPTTIIGVVGDVRQATLDRNPLAELYTPNQQTKWPFLVYSPSIVINSQADAAVMAPMIREALKQVDPYIAVYNLKTMDVVVAESLSDRKLQFMLLSIFAGVALLLAAAGIYGVISYVVTQRTREFAVRLALGAHPRQLVQTVLADQGKLLALGIVIGIAGALACSRLIAAFLYGVQPTDLGTFSTVVLVLGVIALVAAYIPARRATKVDPMVALRYE